MVTIDAGIPGDKTITDAYQSDVEISFAKVDVDGREMANCEFTLTGPGGFSKTLTAPETIANLAKGEYTLTETAVKGYAPLSVTFSVDESGYVVANHPDGQPD